MNFQGKIKDQKEDYCNYKYGDQSQHPTDYGINCIRVQVGGCATFILCPYFNRGCWNTINSLNKVFFRSCVYTFFTIHTWPSSRVNRLYRYAILHTRSEIWDDDAVICPWNFRRSTGLRWSICNNVVCQTFQFCQSELCPANHDSSGVDTHSSHTWWRWWYYNVPRLEGLGQTILTIITCMFGSTSFLSKTEDLSFFSTPSWITRLHCNIIRDLWTCERSSTVVMQYCATLSNRGS